MRVITNHTIILATIFSTIIHFFALALLDTFPLIPKRITPRSHIFMVELLPLKKATPQKEVKSRETKKEVKKKQKGVILTERTKIKKEKPKVDDEQKRLAAIKEIERKVAERRTEEAPASSSQMEFYFGAVRKRVKRFWVIPDTLLEEEGLEAVIVIEIDKDGLLIGSRFERSSGNPYFDQSAMRAITKAAPFPPPPMGTAPLEIGLVFQPQ